MYSIPDHTEQYKTDVSRKIVNVMQVPKAHDFYFQCQCMSLTGC